MIYSLQCRYSVCYSVSLSHYIIFILHSTHYFRFVLYSLFCVFYWYTLYTSFLWTPVPYYHNCVCVCVYACGYVCCFLCADFTCTLAVSECTCICMLYMWYVIVLCTFYLCSTYPYTYVSYLCSVSTHGVYADISCHSWYSASGIRWHTPTTYYLLIIFHAIRVVYPLHYSQWLPCHFPSSCSVCVLVCCVRVCRCVCDAWMGAVSEDPHTVFSHSHVYAGFSLCVYVCLHGLSVCVLCCVCVAWCVGACVTYVCALCTKVYGAYQATCVIQPCTSTHIHTHTYAFISVYSRVHARCLPCVCLCECLCMVCV
jgi:hypothetical protein